MLKFSCFIILTISFLHGYSQPKTMAEIKTEMEKSPNSPTLCKGYIEEKIQTGHGRCYTNHTF